MKRFAYVAAMALAIFVLFPSIAESDTLTYQYLISESTLSATYQPPQYYSPQQIVKRVFGTQYKIALAVFTCESHFNPLAVSTTDDYGIAQINLGAHWNEIAGETREEKIRNLFNPEYNIEIAYQVYKRARGFTPWTCYNSGGYLNYVK